MISGAGANRLKSEPVRPDVVEMANSHFATDGKKLDPGEIDRVAPK